MSRQVVFPVIQDFQNFLAGLFKPLLYIGDVFDPPDGVQILMIPQIYADDAYDVGNEGGGLQRLSMAESHYSCGICF